MTNGLNSSRAIFCRQAALRGGELGADDDDEAARRESDARLPSSVLAETGPCLPLSMSTATSAR